MTCGSIKQAEVVDDSAITGRTAATVSVKLNSCKIHGTLILICENCCQNLVYKFFVWDRFILYFALIVLKPSLFLRSIIKSMMKLCYYEEYLHNNFYFISQSTKSTQLNA